MAFPISPLMAPVAKEDAAGAVPKSSLAGLLDAEDWRRAKAALATALDPQGNGSLVGWDNPNSGNKGSFTPVGKPFPLEAGICRVFFAQVDSKGDEQAIKEPHVRISGASGRSPRRNPGERPKFHDVGKARLMPVQIALVGGQEWHLGSPGIIGASP